jgi:lauroyl/myristoyl acyltransferase
MSKLDLNNLEYVMPDETEAEKEVRLKENVANLLSIIDELKEEYTNNNHQEVKEDLKEAIDSLEKLKDKLLH